MTVSMLYTTGLHQEVYTFVDVAEKNRWEAEVMAIKADSSAAFHQKETNGITTAVRTLYDNWIARVMAFKELYSEYKVPWTSSGLSTAPRKLLVWRKPSGIILPRHLFSSEQRKQKPKN